MSCAQPVSWLRLERRQLGELGERERAEVEAHLSGCAECSQAAASLVSWNGRVPALPAVERRRRWWSPWLLAVPAAAALALVLWPRQPVGVKGSDVALTLVRERAGDVGLDPRTFAPTDRFKLLVTCPTPQVLAWDVVVFQGKEVSFPVPQPRPVSCANRVPLPGALRLTGTTPVTICLLWNGADRDLIRQKEPTTLGPHAHCEQVLPAGGP